MRIYVSGSLAFDRIMSFPGKFSDHILPDKIHILNVCFLVDGLDEKFGGTAGNIAYSLALLGESPIVIAVSGKDFGPYEKWMRKHGLSLEGIRHAPKELTAGAYITTDQSDNQITGFHPAAMKEQAGFQIDKSVRDGAIAIVSPGNLEDMQHYPRVYRELNIPYIFDPGQNITAFNGKQLEEMITGSSVLVSNDYELQLICNATGLSVEQLMDLTGAIITTLGEKGSLVRKQDGEFEVPPAPADPIADPTGAGDAFRSGLIKGLVMGKPLEEAAKLGSVAAAYAVEHKGTQEHSYTQDEFWARYEQTFGKA